MTGDGGDRCISGTIEGILIGSAQVIKENFHRLGSLEWEPGVGAIIGKLFWQGGKDEATKYASMSRGARITLAVCEAPRCEIVRGIIRSEIAVVKAIASLRIARLIVYPAKRDMLGRYDNTRRHKRTRAETCAFNQTLRLFSLQANIKLKIVNMTVQPLSCLRNFRIRVPFQEIRVGCRTKVSYGSS
jgi:hypothetical protein